MKVAELYQGYNGEFFEILSFSDNAACVSNTILKHRKKQLRLQRSLGKCISILKIKTE